MEDRDEGYDLFGDQLSGIFVQHVDPDSRKILRTKIHMYKIQHVESSKSRKS
jgi:hypothetical protein